MTSLEQIVLPLSESLALVKAGIVLDTALVSFHYGNTEHWGLVTREDALQYARMNTDNDIPRPVLSELLDAIRVASSDTSTVSFTLGDGMRTCCASKLFVNAIWSRHLPTDLLAAYDVLMEVSR